MQRKQFTIARLTIALDALGAPISNARHRSAWIRWCCILVAVIGSGTLDSLPHSGAVVTHLSVCGSTHSASYKVIFMVGILDAIIALVVVIELGSLVGSF